MAYDFLLNDINSKLTQKAIGTDKGLAKIGDGIVNLVYSVAKSEYLTWNGNNRKVVRTGKKVSKKILSDALKNAMKSLPNFPGDIPEELLNIAFDKFRISWWLRKLLIHNKNFKLLLEYFVRTSVKLCHEEILREIKSLEDEEEKNK